MHRFRVASLIVVIAVLLVAGGLGVASLSKVAYTDQQIQTSLVDTWEVEAGNTMTLLALFASSIALSLALAYRGATVVRRLSAMVVVIAILAGVLVCSTHIALTNRTTRLTGQTFGAFYGLL